jgi:site-specific recombinase XerD
MQQDLHLQFDSNEQMARSSDADSILSARILKELPRKRKQHAVSGKKSVSVDPSASSVGRQTKRRKVKCPVLHCTAEVVHLPRHLRLSHGWKAEDARTALQRSCLRKTYTLKNPHKPRVSSDRHKPRQCPIDGCLSVVKRLPPHLQQHHHIDLKSSLYRELLMTSRRVQKDKKRGLLGDEGYSEESESSEANGFVAEVSDADEEDGPSSQQWSSCRPPAVMDSMQGSSNTALGEIADEERESCVPRQMKVKATRALVDDECAEFASWLASADGGLKDNKCAKQHACQIKTIITAVDSDETGSAVLLEKKTIQDRFLGCYVDQKNLAPGTIKSYLTSLRHWYSFLLQKNAATQTQEMKQHIHTLHDCIGHWLSSYRKECSKRLLTKMDNDMHKLITPKQIKMFEKSLPALDAVKLLGEMCNAERKLFLSQHQYVLLRDFLLLQILLSNANRSGVLREVTVDQIKQAREVDGRIVISVQEHKTAWKYGPAKLVVTAMVMSWLRIFIRHVRPQVLEGKMNEGERHLFLSWTGEQLSSGQISKSLQTIWKRAGLGEDITCTLVRKSAVTAVHEHQPALKANLAGLMCHAQETATKYYRIVEKEKTSVAAAKALNEVMRGESSGTKDATREESGGKGNMRGELRKTHSRLIRDTTKDDTVTEQSTDASDRFVWSHDLVHTLQSVFADELRSHSIRLETVKMKIATSSVLAKVEAKKVYDKVRSLISKGAPDQETVNNDLAGALLQLPSDTLEDRMNRTTAVDSDAASDIVPPTTLATKIHKLYDDNAVTIIASLCKEIIRGGAISRDRIQAALSSCADGASLLQQFSMDQLMSRVKYERRKTRAHDNRQADC